LLMVRMVFQAATEEDYRQPWAVVAFVAAAVETQLIRTRSSFYLGAERRRTVLFERGP
jgi:hypothetical protein